MTTKTQSIKVEEELWKDVKIYCIRNNIKIQKFTDEAFNERLGEKNEK